MIWLDGLFKERVSYFRELFILSLLLTQFFGEVVSVEKHFKYIFFVFQLAVRLTAVAPHIVLVYVRFTNSNSSFLEKNYSENAKKVVVWANFFAQQVQLSYGCLWKLLFV